MDTLKEKINNLLDGTILEDEMKSFISTYLADRYQASIVLDNSEISNITNNIDNTLDFITPIQFYNLLRRHQASFDFITGDMIEDIRVNLNTLDDNKINNLFTQDQYRRILEKESSNRAKYTNSVDDEFLSDLIDQKLSTAIDSDTVTEDEAVSIIDKYFDDHFLNPSEMVDKTSSKEIALQVFNDNLKNVTSNLMIEQKILDEVNKAKGNDLTEQKVSDIIYENIKDLPKDALNLEEILALINNTVGKVINNTLNTKTLINYVLRQLEVKKWICEVTNPHQITNCPSAEEDENIIQLRAPFKIQESENILYTIISNRAYSNDALIHLSNGIVINLPQGEKIATAVCGPDVYNKTDDAYKNEEIYIVNIDKVEGLVGYEEYSTDISSTAMTIIEDMPTTTEVVLTFPETIFAYVPFDFTVTVSDAPQTDFKVMVKFGKDYKTVIIKAGEYSVTEEMSIEKPGMIFSGITDTFGGNYEKLKYDDAFQLFVFPPGKHVMYFIDAPDTAKEGDTVLIKFKVNKSTLEGNTQIKVNMNGTLMDFTIPKGETEVSYTLALPNNVWKD